MYSGQIFGTNTGDGQKNAYIQISGWKCWWAIDASSISWLLNAGFRATTAYTNFFGAGAGSRNKCTIV
jgi:hypothetical protein